jgi:6-pyruvoyltetrahydropterin/6-carboxytetrahydropterin synthase
MNHGGKCRHLHGHSVKAAISISHDDLNDQSMVCDFSDVKDCVENYVNTHLDHNFLLHKDDPIIPALIQNNERFMVLDEHPTAEVLSKMLFNHLQENGFKVSEVTLWETASASATYRAKS